MKFLPIGTVVILKNATKKVMVIGFLATDKNNNKKVYDYVGCPYPEGVVSNKQYLLFNHAQIENVFHVGYEDAEGKDIKNKLLEIDN
ncbi:MAG: DUF4176 domain-containing protein [Bacilli bacterium]|nr:DUF4176 domain-containing protein [Bacilli bacterium]